MGNTLYANIVGISMVAMNRPLCMAFCFLSRQFRLHGSLFSRVESVKKLACHRVPTRGRRVTDTVGRVRVIVAMTKAPSACPAIWHPRHPDVFVSISFAPKGILC